MKEIKSIAALASRFGMLPGVGRKTALRYAHGFSRVTARARSCTRRDRLVNLTTGCASGHHRALAMGIDKKSPPLL